MSNPLFDSLKESFEKVGDAAKKGRDATIKELKENGLRPLKPLSVDDETDNAEKEQETD